MTVGPFDVTTERIAALGNRFTAFVGRLLETEASRSQMAGYRLAVNYVDTIPDEGVDASIRSAPGGDYIPSGDSAWQFKRSNHGPTACADELKKATWAHEFLRAGGSYILVLGVALPDNLIERRRKAAANKAVALDLIKADDRDRIRVYDANVLARWASLFPSLAASRLLDGPGSDVVDFETWSDTRWHQTLWVEDAARNTAMNSIRAQVASSGVVEVRVQGESGIGKSRLVMETLRTPELRPLVAYVHDAAAVRGEVLAHLAGEGRTAILVADDCPPERHVKLVERLPSDPGIRLVTIGDSGPAATRGPVFGVDPIDAETTDEFLKRNYATLSTEAPASSRTIVAATFAGPWCWPNVSQPPPRRRLPS